RLSLRRARRGGAARLCVRCAQDRRARPRAPPRGHARAARPRMAAPAREAARARSGAAPIARARPATGRTSAVSDRGRRNRVVGAPVIETRFTKLVGASAPIQVAAMPGVTTIELVAAAADAGAVGMLGATGWPAERLDAELARLAQ